jgi:tetratricopeptide (TPR) repeat protein
MKTRHSKSLDRGIALYNLGQYPAAAECFLRALRLGPADPRPKFFLANALRSLGDAQGALKLLEELNQSCPRSLQAALGLGEVLEAVDILSAERLYRSLTRLHPALAAPWLWLARLAYRRGELISARRLFREVLLRKGGRLEGGLGLYSTCAALRDFEGAFDAAERVLSFDQSQDTLQRLSAPLSDFPPQRHPGLWRGLESALRRRLRRRPGSPWDMLVLTFVLLELNRSEEALGVSAGMRALGRRYAWMRHLRGKIMLTYSADYAGAEAEFSAAWRGARRLWKAKAFLAEIQLCRGRSARAWRLFEGLMRGLPRSERPQARAWRGEARLWVGRYREALADFESGARSGLMFARYWEGAALLKLGRVRKALAALDLYLPTNMLDVEALTWRGEARRRAGMPREAIADLDAALALDPRNFFALCNRALARLELRDPQGFWSDVRDIPPEVRDFLESQSGRRLTPPLPERAGRAALESLLELSRGVRIPQRYLFPIWMRRTSQHTRSSDEK